MPKRRREYTKEFLEPLVKGSVSYRELIRKLGYRVWSGGIQSFLKQKIVAYGIDTSHMLGQAANQGARHKGGPIGRSFDKILILRSEGRRENVRSLRKALVASGLEQRCCSCGMGSEWNSKKLVLQIEHLNGDPLDNRVGNLRFICPNCHSQTDTFSGRNSRHMAW